MAFDARTFERAKLEPRTKSVDVPGLAEFFGDDPPVWVVRGLTAAELFRCNEAMKSVKVTEKIVKAISDNQATVDDLRTALGLVEKVPGELAKRLEMLVAGSVEPKVPLPIAVRIGEFFPIEFVTLTNEITELTGQGGQLVKHEAASLETAS